jgi:hypothetical protein
MIKSRVSLAIVLSSTILGGVLLSSVSANAFPCSKSSSSSPNAVNPTKSSDSPLKESVQPEQSTNPNESAINPIQSNSTTDLKIAGMGLATIAGFFVFGLLQRVRQAKKFDPQLNEMLDRHPELEHPELVLTSLPKEGCTSSKLPEEVFSVR